MLRNLLFVTLFFVSDICAGFAEEQLTFSTGTITTNYTESASGLESSSTTTTTTTETEELAAGAVAALPLSFTYEMYLDTKRSFFAQGIVPLVSSTPDSYFFIGGGFNFYFMSIGTKAVFKDRDVELRLIPNWRYYWGFNGGIGYLIYTTEVKKKSDLLAELGLHTGALYSLGEIWGLKVEGGISRGQGVSTAATSIRILLGATYYLK